MPHEYDRVKLAGEGCLCYAVVEKGKATNMNDNKSGGEGEVSSGGLGMRKVLNLGREIVVRCMIG